MEEKHKITIPQPCHENWDKMTPKDNGRFCMSCSKTVIDFSAMLPDEIQIFFIQNQNEKICGRFKNSQLQTLTIQIPSRILYSQTHYSKIFLLALFVSMGTTLFSCEDKNGDKKKIDKIEIVEDNLTTKKDYKQNPQQSTKKIIEEDSEIVRPIMTSGEVVALDVKDNPYGTSINYDTIFKASYLDVLPVPEGGMDKFYSFLKTNYIIPDKTEKYTGKIYTSFVIEKDGSLSTFKIIRDAGPGTGEEAIRVLKMAPKWIPGKLNNHVVRATYMLPISFSCK